MNGQISINYVIDGYHINFFYYTIVYFIMCRCNDIVDLLGYSGGNKNTRKTHEKENLLKKRTR